MEENSAQSKKKHFDTFTFPARKWMMDKLRVEMQTPAPFRDHNFHRSSLIFREKWRSEVAASVVSNVSCFEIYHGTEF